jgi:hypothetical protein
LVAFENGIETNRSSLNKECSQIENEIAWICWRRFFAWLFISLFFPNSSVIITSFLSLNLWSLVLDSFQVHLNDQWLSIFLMLFRF